MSALPKPGEASATRCHVFLNPNLAVIRGSGGEAGKVEAERFAANVLPIIAQVRKAGASTLQQIADALNDRGVATARGGNRYPSNVRNVLARG